MEAPSGLYEVIRGPRPPSVRRTSVSGLGVSCSKEKKERWRSGSSVRPQPNAGQQPSSKVDPSKLKVKKLECALNALGPEQSAARACLEEVLKKAKTEGSTESRDTTTRPPEASLAEANAKMARLQGSLAAVGSDDIAERRVLEDALAKVRARAIVAPVWQRLDECEKFCERVAKRVEKAQDVVAVEGSDEERGGVGGGEASFGNTPSRSCSPPSSAACRSRDKLS